MITSGSALPDAAKRQIRIGDVHERIIDATAPKRQSV